MMTSPNEFADPAKQPSLPAIPTFAEVKADPGALSRFNQLVVERFRAGGGVVGGPFADSNVLLLTITGAKTGKRRVTPLEYFPVDGRIILMGTYGGAPRDPAWVHNIRANPRVRVEIGTDSYDGIANELPAGERDALVAEIASKSPRVANYPRPSRSFPVFEILEAGQLSGDPIA